MSRCEAFHEMSGKQVCVGKCKYGTFCYKHRSMYLLRDNLIDEVKFTGLSKDYLAKDLYNYCVLYASPSTFSKKSSKGELFNVVASLISLRSFYKDPLTCSSCIYIQKLWRGHEIRTKYECQNTEDFFTFELLREIPPLYYFSYKDMQGMRWGFDIRSLYRLIQMNFSNPYTTHEIPESVKQAMNTRITSLVKQGLSMDIQDMIDNDTKQSIKQRTVDLFSRIEQSGYSCDIKWFLELQLCQLKELYKQLEDIWNYRAQLPSHIKREICPPHGRLFTRPMLLVMNETNKERLQDLILTDISMFSASTHESNQKLGYMYFVIALGYVSQGCFAAHRDWLMHVN
jgi:hypothetical protein